MILRKLKPLKFLLFASAAIFFLASCDKDDDDAQTMSYDYSLHNGQVVATAPYVGTHSTDFTATLTITENGDGSTVTVTLNNTIDGQTYHTHAHDGADPASTPNGTPYNETPNADVFANAIAGNGGTVSVSQESSMSFEELTTNYTGFFVVHDPLQDISTTNISTYLVVGAFAAAQPSVSYASSTYSYDFNTGQLVPDFAYVGTHATDLSASITVDELAGDQTRIIVSINNSINGETYHTHAHDMADPATTPNGTPYLEAPNAGVFANPIMGNGGTASLAQLSASSYSDITTSYDGFFVIHDPLQAITTTDPTTYVVLGVFAR